MPEETLIAPTLESVLEPLEDHSLDNPHTRTQNYLAIQNALDSGALISINIIERILDICVHSMKDDMKNTTVLLNIISSVLSRIKAGEYSPAPDLVPSALAVMSIMNTTFQVFLIKVDTLKAFCMDTLLSYPDDTLVTIATLHCTEVMELLKLQGYERTTLEFRLLTVNITYKLLTILPPDKKSDFIKAGIPIWFSVTVPAIVSHLMRGNVEISKPLEILELLTDELVKIDYTENAQWKDFLESSICDPKKYPELMKSLLEKGSPVWHRLWIVFIRLLNNQITRNTSSVGTPINSMLPVVEAAFKMDATNRCRAFQCWSVLIDNFCNETNENCINKRLKLLIIPLRLNNAKVEETASAKFDTWWRLIIKFQNRLDKFVDTVLISFLHFCFGKHNASGKSTFIAGQLSSGLKRKSVQALVEIVGHTHCDGCTDLPKLKGRLITTKYLVEHWNDWAHSLKTAIKFSAGDSNISTAQQGKCLWKSFLLTIGDLPDNNIRKDLFNELLAILALMVQDCKNDDSFADFVFNVLILSLFDEETKIRQLLKTKGKEIGVVHKIVKIMTEPSLKHFYQSHNTRDLIAKLKPLTNFIVDECLSSPKHVIEWLLEDMPSNDTTLKLWTALSESICASEYDICAHNLHNMLLWPLNSMNLFTDIKFPANTWYTTYNLLYSKLCKTDIEKEISRILLSSNVVTNSSTYFALCATLAILKNGLAKENGCREYDKEAELLHSILNRIDCYENVQEMFPIIVDTLVVMLNNTTEAVNDNLAKHTITAVRNVLKLITPVLEQQSDVGSNVLVIMEHLLRHLSNFFKIECYSKLVSVIADDLTRHSSILNEYQSLKNLILTIMKPPTDTNIEINDKGVTNKIETINTDVTADACSQDLGKSKFSTPSTKVPKKGKKKETSIVNTVVENGEEYVVVKSNWKFNPRKLTENQKEKLQRKREDIPALYQDLSQSQDEYKLTIWKTDSQDTSTTSKSDSKSANEGADASFILKNLASTDVLPKIMEKFLSDKDKKEADIVKELPREGSINIFNQSTPKTPKTPRMALKDRVFRNVRNLIEKSTIQKVGKDGAEDQNQIENIPKTPPPKPKINTLNIINSAPSLLVSERPSRVKRKPKKFDDLQIFELKKRRHSQNDSQPDIENLDNTNSTVNVLETINTDAKPVNIEQLPVKDSPNPKEVQEKSDYLEESENVAFIADKTLRTNIENVEMLQDNQNKDEINKIDIKVKCDTNTVDDSKVIEDSCTVEETSEGDNGITVVNNTNDVEISTPKDSSQKREGEELKLTVKKNRVKKSRIEKELAIDMVEGHPFLNTPSPSEKRTRNNLASPINSIRRRKMANKLNKSKSEIENIIQEKGKLLNEKTISVTVSETQGRDCDSPKNHLGSDDLCSEDVIESSQDSTLTTITVTKKTPKKLPIISIEKLEINTKADENISETQDLLQDQDCEMISSHDSLPAVNISEKEHKITVHNQREEKPQENVMNVDNTMQDTGEPVSFANWSLINLEGKHDIELPINKTLEDKNETESTENMETQPIGDKDISDDVIIINDDDEETPIIISSDEPGVGSDTQEIAEADTQPSDPTDFTEIRTEVVAIVHDEPNKSESVTAVQNDDNKNISKENPIATQDEITKTISESIDISITDIEKPSDVSSPFKDDDERKQDFLNNTLEISPIKILSPDRDKKTPSPDTSGDYVVITLSPPVHSNGEPFEKGSPEFFTDDKISPDKRDHSPPRVEVSVTNTSPSSSLSLKKNRPQVRVGGRAAQMLGLCVPDNTILNSERPEPEEDKKSSPSNTPVRRNLRILYNSVEGNNDNSSVSEDSVSFLKLKRSLPAVNVSPSGPILKRKLAEIADETTVSPANKRKRVSFHDPPVSTTVSVQKYIEPCGVRSPQSSAQKRQERQMRPYGNLKSPKRLDAVFKLDSALTKAVESFTEVDLIVPSADDTQMTSLDQTPAVEIVKTNELNDTDPICAELLHCKDPIENIAGDLSSPAMKTLLIKELEGKVETVGDLAKMTELEVNRLCIKAPKVKIAKKVLTDYASKRVEDNVGDIADAQSDVDIKVTEPVVRSVSIEVQTDEILSSDVEMQTAAEPLSLASTQTENVPSTHTSVQTEESGYKSTADIIALCLTERPDFVDQLGEQLEEASILRITDKLSCNAINDALVKKITAANSNMVLNTVLEHPSIQESSSEQNKALSFLRDYITDKFDSKDLILFCSQLLQRVYDKPA